MSSRIFVFVIFCLLWGASAQATVVQSLAFLNVNTGAAIPGHNPFQNGTVINFTAATSKELVIKPKVDATTRSVVWRIDGKLYQASNNNPIWLCPNGDCSQWTAGPHTISAQPFTDYNGAGKAGAIYQVSFVASTGTAGGDTPTDPPSGEPTQLPVVQSLAFLNVNTGAAVPGHNPFQNGTEINFTAATSKELVIKPKVDATTLSVVWRIDGSVYHTSNTNPIWLCPNNDCSKWTAGTHTVSAQPFTDYNGAGKAGAIYQVSFIASTGTTDGGTPTDTSWSAGVSSTGYCNEDRAFWLWTTRQVLSSPEEQNALIAESLKYKITDIHMNLGPNDYVRLQAQLQAFIRKLSANKIRAWGLDGWRGFFADAYGPAKYYASIDALVAYNDRVAANERFVGFEADLEPNDGQGAEFRTTFHNELTDSQLSTTGGGVWYATQAQDRDYLMRDWIKLFETSKQKLRAANLRFAAAMPTWLGDFYGEKVYVTHNGVRQDVMPIMMRLVDEYMVMSYNTSPQHVAGRMAFPLAYADTMPQAERPRIYAGIDVFPGNGVTESYADTPGKNSKAVAMNDMATITSLLKQYKSYCGTNIHDWAGWDTLNP